MPSTTHPSVTVHDPHVTGAKIVGAERSGVPFAAIKLGPHVDLYLGSVDQLNELADACRSLVRPLETATLLHAERTEAGAA